MDIQLPVMDGYTATRQIKADPAFRSIPIIAVTSYALSGEEKKARVAGCDDYVPKPFSPRQLLAKIRQILVVSQASIAAVHESALVRTLPTSCAVGLRRRRHPLRRRRIERPAKATRPL